MPSLTKTKEVIDFKNNFIKSDVDLKQGEERTIINTALNGNIMNFNLGTNSKLTYITFDYGQNEATKNIFNAKLANDAHLEIYNIVTSDKDATINGRVDLNNSGAQVNIINLLLSVGTAKCDSFIDIYHNDVHTESDLVNYAISRDEAVLILNNNATIKKASSKSIAHQQTKGLTLSKSSKIKALPNLYIDEYDVIASHACSIGSINKEDLFYLMSRGLTETEASSIVVMGYVKPILDHISDNNLKEEINKEFVNKLTK